MALAVDPAKVADARRKTGGPSMTDMTDMLAGLVARRDRDAIFLQEIEARLADAGRRLQDAFNECAQ